MRKLIVLALVGFLAQLVDGSLGMGYGVTSSSLLILAGLTPAAASASVHFSELGTNLASGLSHWKLKNVDWRVVSRIAGPGAIGAFVGATVLSSLSTEAAAPIMAAILAVLGAYVLARFVIGFAPPKFKKAISLKFLAPLGLFAGFIDATGGGGWGPVATPALLADGRLQPRKVIGSVDTSEFAVSAAASLGFLVGLGAAGINWGFALALLAGGLIAAPLAAVLVRYAPTHLLGRGDRRPDPAEQLTGPAEELRCPRRHSLVGLRSDPARHPRRPVRRRRPRQEERRCGCRQRCAGVGERLTSPETANGSSLQDRPVLSFSIRLSEGGAPAGRAG